MGVTDGETSRCDFSPTWWQQYFVCFSKKLSQGADSLDFCNSEPIKKKNSKVLNKNKLTKQECDGVL